MNRLLAPALPLLITLGAILWVWENYGNLIIIAVLVCLGMTAAYLAAKHIGPTLPEKWGGDPRGPDPGINWDIVWELYLAVSRSDIEEAKVLLARGADPKANFREDWKPSTTKAANCYDYARQSNNIAMVNLFDETIARRKAL